MRNVKKSTLAMIIIIAGLSLALTIQLRTFINEDKLDILNNKIYMNKNKFDELRKLADHGDMKAQTDLGLAYGTGNGMQKNYTKARYWYEKAAKQGFAEAQFNLGLLYEKSGEYPQAREWYSKAAEQSFTKAQVNLGVLYNQGLGGDIDYEKSRVLFTKAAEKK
ncbi:tetratricopeptide repeat protein [Rahnella selenatireducens]|uniref:tetratricopeptide repeat protein n=1 Tax=Rahnella selenatireducens TaxID=3389797 RepID=UPI003967FA38